MISVDFIQDLAIVLAAAGVAGWICRGLGLSTTIGYLLAGMLIGPYTPPFSLVFDTGRIQVLSQIGLVFLMFAIGLSMSFRKLRNLGPQLFIASAIGVALVILACRAAGWLLRLDLLPSMFLAGILLVSSSAIIGKMLHETGLIHQRFGQAAMGITLVEDWAAMFMFGILGSWIRLGQFEVSSLVGAIGIFMAFMVVVAVAALLTVPRFLSLLQRRATPELQSIMVAALLLLLALLAAKAGYSLALGAFLIGVVVAETAQREQIERSFAGVNDIFTAVFFVAIGMQIEVSLFREIWPQMLLVAALVFFGRTAIHTFAQLVSGRMFAEALRVGLTLTPIGEVSFVIVMLGVTAGILPRTYYPMVVGICLLTTMSATLVVPRSESLARALEQRLPSAVNGLLNAYQRLLVRLRQRKGSSRLWRFMRKRLLQIGVEVLFVSGILVFSENLGERLFAWAGLAPDSFLSGIAVFWAVIGCLLLISMIAIWRNLSALALMFAQSVIRKQPHSPYTMALERLLRVVAAFLLVAWIWMVFPFRAQAGWIPALVAGGLVAVAAVFWRRMIYWHSVVEGRLDRLVRQKASTPGPQRLDSMTDWNLRVEECVLPDHSRHSRKTLDELAIRSRFGVMVAGIERQGELTMNPAASAALYPQDKLLLIGMPENIKAAHAFLQAWSMDESAADQIEDVHLETIYVPENCLYCAQPIGRLNIAGQFGLQIIGLDRAGAKIINPGAAEQLQPGDALLVLGTLAQIRTVEDWLKNDVPAAG